MSTPDIVDPWINEPPDIPYTRLLEPTHSNLTWGAHLFNFTVRQSEMLPEHRAFLIRHLATLRAAPEGSIDVSGTASATGSPAFNLTLSKNRAREVCAFLQFALQIPKEKFLPGQRDRRTGEALGFGHGMVGEPGKEDARSRAVGVLILRPRESPPAE